MLEADVDKDFNDERLLENATYPLLAAFKLFGTRFEKFLTYTRVSQAKSVFNRSVLIYPGGGSVTFAAGTGVKSEGSLVISGTKGYIYVPAPWWKTDYFEVRYENATENKKFYFPYEQAGLRYEIQAFLDSIRGIQGATGGLTGEETLKMIDIQNKMISK